MAARVAIFGRYPAIHNTYLKFLVELGLPGFCLLAWFCVALLRRYRRNSSLTQGEPTSLLYWINRGFGACFLGTGVFALFQGISTFNPFWIVLGLFAATSSAIERAYGDIRDE
jgi:O-antigen ligase